MKRVLIIEDELRLRTNLSMLLVGEGYEVETAPNGSIGIEKVYSFSPDIIVCDIMMPIMNGFQVLEKLMEDKETSTIPFIFLTAKVDYENLRKGMQLGADDYLVKPFNINDLLVAIEVRLKKKESFEQKNEALKEHIITMIPHQLKTPLVPILGYSDLINEESDVEIIKEMARIIKKSGVLLHKRIEKFLFYNSLILQNENPKNYVPSNHSTSINQDEIRCFFSGVEPSLNCMERMQVNIEPATLQIKEDLFQTMIVELVENALKFSDTDKRVLMNGKRVNSKYEMTISDLGRGMKDNELNSISAFNKFGCNKISDPGVGLGLTIVKKIAELHGGALEIHSEPNKFTNSKVSLPIREVRVI